MNQIRINKEKTLAKWSPILETLGVTDPDRLDWLSEYSEYHHINENAYLNAAQTGMGAVFSPQPSALPGALRGTPYSGNGGVDGSGDLGQNLLPVSMKIAAQTIGLDLVAVKPSPGPKIDLVYMDFVYDDVNQDQGTPMLIQYGDSNAAKMATFRAGIRQFLNSVSIPETQGGLQLNGKRVYINIQNGGITLSAPTTTKTNFVEFLGFSRINDDLLLRAFRQTNAVGSGTGVTAPFMWDSTQNTFSPTQSLTSQFVSLPGTAGATAVGTPVLSPVSALEDQVAGFSTNFQSSSQGGLYPMNREEDDLSYAGTIGTKVLTKTVQIGTSQVRSALRRSEIEDIKSNTGIDIVQKIESVLVNELSQTISKQIVARLFEMGDLNRLAAPKVATDTIFGNGSQTIFDFDTAYAATGGPGGETTHAIQRKLVTKVLNASNFISTEGRVGPAHFIVTNGNLATALNDATSYTLNPVRSKMNSTGQLYPAGSIMDIQIYVDPYMKYNDNRILVGRKNNPDQPGVVFIPYLMAQSISLMSEATFAPSMLLRSRYAIANLGWFPEKQYMTIHVKDANTWLS